MHKAGTGQANLNYRGNNVFSAISSAAAKIQERASGPQEAPNCSVCDDTGVVVKKDAQGRNISFPCTACNKLKKEKIAHLTERAQLPRVLVKNLSPHDITARFVRNFDKRRPEWLFFVGKPGSGKTTEAAWSVRALIENKYAVSRFFNAFELTRQLIASKRRNDDHEEILDEITKADLIVLDDLFKAVPKQGSYGYDDFIAATLEIIWTRYDSKKPMIVTTQINFNDIARIDSTLAGRIAELSKGNVVVFDQNATNWRINPRGEFDNEQNRTPIANAKFSAYDNGRGKRILQSVQSYDHQASQKGSYSGLPIRETMAHC